MSRPRRFDVGYTWEEVAHRGLRWTVELWISVDAWPIIPAKIHGPPEDCYPQEGGEIEVVHVCIDELEVHDESDELITVKPDEKLRKQLLARFEKEIEPTDQFQDWLGNAVAGAEEGR